MAMLALKALSVGSEKIPDKAFHAIPGGYFRPDDHHNPLRRNKKKKARDGMHDNGREGSESHDERDHRAEHHHHSSRKDRHKSEDYSASESGNDEDEARRRRPERPGRRNRRYQSSRDLDRGYDSDGMTQQSHGMPPSSQPGPGQYFPPPPVHPYDDQSNHQPGPNSQHVNFTDGAYDNVTRAPEGSGPFTGSYFPQQTSRAPQLRQPPSEAFRPSSAASDDRFRSAYVPSPQPQQSYEPKRSSVNPGYLPHAGYAEQYTAGYQPSQPYNPAQAGQPQQYQGALAVQPPIQQPETGYSNALAPYNMPPPQGDPNMNGAYPTYQPPQDDWTASRSPSPDSHRHHRRSKSRGARSSRDDDGSRDRSRGGSRDRNRGRDHDRGSKSRNRSHSMAAQAKEVLKGNRDVASSALGVVAGGLIGNQVGRGNKIGTLAGAVLGGFGANLWEKQHGDKKKELEKRERERDEARAILSERRRRQQQQHDREQRNQKRSTARSNSERRPRCSDSPPTREHERDFADQERSRRPYARSNPTHPISRAISPHVRFAKPDAKEFVKSATLKATAEDLDSRSDRAATQAMKQDLSTQTSPRRDQPSHRQYQKDFVKKTVEREIPSSKKIYQAAHSIKKATRQGTWDGTVVEEVFMEMTGVTIGAPHKMTSDWKN